ncbi:MAG: prepilin-type N-terminal cleavage/methylation domain-containing protein [Acidobacteriota bacterium]
MDALFAFGSMALHPSFDEMPSGRNDETSRMGGHSPSFNGGWRRESERGFTLIEATISMTLLVVVLVLSLTFLFSMRAFAQRQELFASPRQTARRAMDYVSYYVRGATDMNVRAGNPNALSMYYSVKSGSNFIPQQTTFNNVTNAAYADVGTDLINMAKPTGTLLIPIIDWPGFQHAANVRFSFDLGCPDSDLNMELFKEMTGYIPGSNPSASGLLTLVDDTGQWAYYQITNYLESGNIDNCEPHTGSGWEGSTGPEIHVTNNPGQSDGINPPAGQPNLVNPKLASISYISFRVKNGQLQQRQGLFDLNNPDAGYVPLLDDVEDLQIAYVYNDGTIWNTATQVLTTPNAIPPQDNPAVDVRDAVNVSGLRVTVTARSDELPATLLKQARYNRPAAEDRAAGAADRRFHYRLTTTVMLRNRILGS